MTDLDKTGRRMNDRTNDRTNDIMNEGKSWLALIINLSERLIWTNWQKSCLHFLDIHFKNKFRTEFMSDMLHEKLMASPKYFIHHWFSAEIICFNTKKLRADWPSHN